MFNRTRVRSPILVHMNTVNPIPAGYRTITPYLAVPDGHAALDYYKRALGAEIVDAMNAPDGSLMHAEIRIGDSMLQLSQEMPDFGLKSPQDGWVHSSIVVYTEDTDEFVARAVAEGGTLVTAVADTFSGDRHGVFLDPFGHRWAVCTKVEDVPAEEVARRARALFFPKTQSPQ